MRKVVAFLILCFLCLGVGCSSTTVIPSEWKEEMSSDGVKISFNAEIDALIDKEAQQFRVSQTTFRPEACVSLINYFAKESIEQKIELPHVGNYKTNAGMEISCFVYENYFYLQKFSVGFVQLENWIIPGDAFPGEPKGTTLNNILISKENAVALANDTLDELGIRYMTLIDASKARILAPRHKTKSEGWYISFARGYSGYYPIDLSAILPNFNMQDVQSELKAPWLPEMIFMYIDEGGVQLFQWSDPVLLVDAKKSQVNLLAFSKIQDVIRNYFLENYLWDMHGATNENAPRISRIALTGALLSREVDSKIGNILPVWVVFYTTQTHIQDYCNPSVVCFSAIDGMKVDPFVLWENEDLQ